MPNGRIPIGVIADDVELLFLGEGGAPVERGEVGEIVVRARHLAAGYWRQPELTARRFSGEIGEIREFRTGDLGRINAGGFLEYAGRGDSRVKIRGNRVELGDVESALQRLPDVERAVVESVEKDDYERALVAYVVLNSGHSRTPQSLRMELRELLPDHMVPSGFVLLDRFPITSSGKIDREKLRQLAAALRLQEPVAQSAPEEAPMSAQVEPRTLQQTLLSIWREVLNRSDIGYDDDFFELGGDSLSAVDLLLRIEEELHYQLPLTVLMEAPKIHQLAARLERATLGAVDNLIRVHETGYQTPVFAVGGRYGHVARLIPVMRSLGLDQPCYGLQPPGMDWSTVGCTTVPEMARHYIGEIKAVKPHGPYRLLGTSFGGLMVFEIALQLQRQGEQVEFLGMVDTSAATCLFGGKSYVGRSRFLEEGPPPQRAESIEATNRRLADSHVRARRQYVLDARSDHQMFRGELTYFYCMGNPIIPGKERRHYWRWFAGGGYRLLPLPGIHGTFHQEPQATALAKTLRACLDGKPPAGDDPERVFSLAFRLEMREEREWVVSSMGESYVVERGFMQGRVEGVRLRADELQIGGWALEPCRTRPAQTIAIFVGDRYLGYGGTGVMRPDVVAHFGTPSVRDAGFNFFLMCDSPAATSGQPRLFVLTSDGRASELEVLTRATSWRTLFSVWPPSIKRSRAGAM